MNFKIHGKNKSLMLQSPKHSEPLKYQEKQSSSPASKNLLQKARDAYYYKSDFKTAIQLFEQYLYLYPKSNQALYLCGVACLQINRSEEAISRLKLVTQEFQNHANSVLLTAMAINRLGNKNKSLEIMDNCLRMYPHFEEALCFRGQLNLQMGCYMQAQVDFRAAVGTKKNSYLGYMGLGDCLRAINRFDKAISLYQKAEERVREQHQKNRNLLLQLSFKISTCLYNTE